MALIDPESNIGILTGNVSKLVVIDFDDAAATIDHPRTPEVKTHRNKHLYFAADHVEFTTKKHNLFGEIKGNSAYTVAPPSYHKSGHQYRWEVSIKDVRLAIFHSRIIRL